MRDSETNVEFNMYFKEPTQKQKRIEEYENNRNKILKIISLIKNKTNSSEDKYSLFINCLASEEISKIKKKSSEKSLKKHKEQFQTELVKNMLDLNEIKQYQKLIYTKINETQMKKHIKELYNGIIYSTKLRGASQQHMSENQIVLKEVQGSNKKFLMLDLDETLIYSKKIISSQNYRQMDVDCRPYLFQFLEAMSSLYEIYVFTSASESYARAIIKEINSNKRYIKDYLHRDYCFETKKGKYIKDLRIIKNRTLKDIIIVDNLVQSFGLQIQNGIPILQYKGNPNDQELVNLKTILEQAAHVNDVRKFIKKTINLKMLATATKENISQYLNQNNYHQ